MTPIVSQVSAGGDHFFQPRHQVGNLGGWLLVALVEDLMKLAEAGLEAPGLRLRSCLPSTSLRLGEMISQHAKGNGGSRRQDQACQAKSQRQHHGDAQQQQRAGSCTGKIARLDAQLK